MVTIRQARSLIEPELAYEAAANATPELIADLNLLNQQLKAAVGNQELFARLDGADLGPRPDTAAMAAALARGDLAAAAACLGNVFERVLTEEEGEEIRSIKEALLRHGALGAAMSGSGPTVFGLFDDRQKAVRAKEALEGRYRQTYLAAPVKILEKME